MRFSTKCMMLPSVFTYIRHCMLFPTEIELQNVVRLVIIPRDSMISLILYISFI